MTNHYKYNSILHRQSHNNNTTTTSGTTVPTHTAPLSPTRRGQGRGSRGRSLSSASTSSNTSHTSSSTRNRRTIFPTVTLEKKPSSSSSSSTSSSLTSNHHHHYHSPSRVLQKTPTSSSSSPSSSLPPSSSPSQRKRSFLNPPPKIQNQRRTFLPTSPQKEQHSSQSRRSQSLYSTTSEGVSISTARATNGIANANTNTNANISPSTNTTANASPNSLSTNSNNGTSTLQYSVPPSMSIPVVFTNSNNNSSNNNSSNSNGSQHTKERGGAGEEFYYHQSNSARTIPTANTKSLSLPLVPPSTVSPSTVSTSSSTTNCEDKYKYKYSSPLSFQKSNSPFRAIPLSQGKGQYKYQQEHEHHVDVDVDVNVPLPTLPTASSLSSSSSSDSNLIATAPVIITASPDQMQGQGQSSNIVTAAANAHSNKNISTTSNNINSSTANSAMSSRNVPQSLSSPSSSTNNTPPKPVSNIQNNNNNNNGNENGNGNSNGKDNKHNQKNTLEKRLFHALHASKVNNPSIKEFKECWAFASSVQKFYCPNKKKKHSLTNDNNNNNDGGIDLVLDVAGGHGALGALLLILLKSTSKCVVIDPACEDVKGGVEKAWGKDFLHKDNASISTSENVNTQTKPKKELIYRNECLRTGLRDELHKAIHGQSLSPKRILVVACHACQHLSDETLEIACSYGVHVAVMPCCQKDLTGGSFKATAKQLKMNIGVLMDLLAAGKVLSWNNGSRYQVKVKLVDETITPQNRLILARAVDLEGEDHERQKIKEAHERLLRAYDRAHSGAKRGVSRIQETLRASVCMKSLGVGIATGVILSIAWSRKR